MDIEPPTNPTHNPVAPAKSRIRSMFTSLAVLLIAPVFAALLTVFVFQSYQVSGMSMEGTLHDNDRLVVWKGSRSWVRLFGGQYIPNRGDVVIVKQDSSTVCDGSAKVIIKRVIGLPGDRVVYKDGAHAVYNAAHPDGFNPDTSLDYNQNGQARLSNPASQTVDVTLGSSELFISGDNRANSCDSRYFGPIQSDQIIGKTVARIYPLSDIEKL